MALRLTARIAGVDDDGDLIFVGVGEHPSGEGWSLVFQGPLEYDDSYPDEKPCLVTETGACVYGGVNRLSLRDGLLRLSLTQAATTELGLADRDIEVRLDVDAASRALLRDGLARLFAAISPDNRPFRLELPGSTPTVRGRPLRSRLPGFRPKSGKRVVEYEVIALRGDLVDVEVVGQQGMTGPTEVARFLAAALGVSSDDLVGCRYTCEVTPDRYGETRSNYRLVALSRDS